MYLVRRGIWNCMVSMISLNLDIHEKIGRKFPNFFSDHIDIERLGGKIWYRLIEKST